MFGRAGSWVAPLVLLLVVGVLPTLVTQPAAQAAAVPPGVALRDIHADEGRSVPAYLPVTSSRRVVRVFSVEFRAVAGERRYVTARAVARQARTTSDQLLMASVSLSCSPSGPGATSAGATQNLLRGSSAVLSPRFVYVVPRTGTVVCSLAASGLRPRPVGRRPRSNTWSVQPGSSLTVSAPLPGWARTVTSGARSRVLDRAEHWTPVNEVVRVRAGLRRFAVATDHKVTTCSAVGGSRDSSTLGRELCAGRVDKSGTMVRVTVTAVQLGRDRRPCAAPRSATTRRLVRAVVHHQVLHLATSVPVSRARGCTPVFRVRVQVKNAGGADVVIHAPSMRTMLLPR